MDGSNADQDPMLWDVETVSRKLCLPGQPWLRDSAALARMVQEQQFDGQTLLTFDQCFSRMELMQALGFSTAQQKTSFARVIVAWQARSKTFQSWKRELQADLSPTTALETAPEPRLNHNLTPQSTIGSPPRPDLAAASSAEDSTSATRKRQDGHEIDDSRPAKKIRMVPVYLGTRSEVDGSLVAPEFKVPDPAVVTVKHAGQDPFAYLGSNAFDMLALKSPAGAAGLQLADDNDPDHEDNDDFTSPFTFVASSRPPPGLRRVVADAIKNMLIRNGRRERLHNEGFSTTQSPDPSAENQQDPAIAWFDLPDEVDDETRKEMEEEQAENQARQREAERCLTQERVEAILQEALASMKAKWEEKKLPRHQRKAYDIWTGARKRERTKALLFEAQQNARNYSGRLKKYRGEIIMDKWHKEQDVRDQALILEQTLEDQLYNSWLVGLLQSRVQPDRPAVIPRPRKSPAVRTSSLDEEILTSDDDLADFIIEDEQISAPDNRGSARPIVQTPAPPPQNQEIEMIDLTLVETPPRSPTEPQPPRQSLAISTPRDADSLRRPTPKPKRALPLLDGQALAPPVMDELEDVSSIGKRPPKYWEGRQDRWRLAISTMIHRLDDERRRDIFETIEGQHPDDVWIDFVKEHLDFPAIVKYELQWASPERLLAIDITMVFLSFLKLKAMPWVDIWQLDQGDRKLLRRYKGRVWATFAAFLEELSLRFDGQGRPNPPAIASQTIAATASRPTPVIGSSTTPVTGRTPGAEASVESNDGLSSNQTPSGRRVVKQVVQDRAALDLRAREERRIKEQDARRNKLRANLANSNIIPYDQTRLIINESKQDDQPFVYVNRTIGERIKDHQIDGVRFLWNSIIRDADVRQGCLLAHTMGMGKTMQVITFLVAILEAAASDDLSVRSLIPEDLRRFQALVICPPGLVENWEEEVLKWAPKSLIGHPRAIDSSMDMAERFSTIRDWSKDGGLLIMGYQMFTRICSASSDTSDSQLGPSMEKLLLETPSLVVADEAHTFKNSTAKVHQACARFKTGSRIALTGTPLANNVDEYYSMINWVAPNFLGPSKEFNQIYSNPIQAGLDVDSGPGEKREALKMMEVLKRTVDPKVNRAAISRIKSDLPPKHEFVLFVPPTQLQKRLYNLYMGHIEGQPSQAKIFNIVNDLTLICNHPICMRGNAKDIVKRAKDNAKSDNSSEEPSSVSEELATMILKETNSRDMNVPDLSRKVELLLMILEEARRLKEKVLVFSQSIRTLDYLENLLTMQKRLVLRLDGDTKMAVRQDQTKNFNEGQYEAYLISTRAGGMGLNIQGANRVVIFDLKWNPVNEQQAIGRAYRIGQTKTVYVYYLLVSGSVEEVLHKKGVFKTQLASRLIDKKNPVNWGKRVGAFGPIRPRPREPLEPLLKRDVILDKLIRYKPSGEAINRIMSTDTFEEEDYSSKVTPDMDVQIKEFMRLESIRRTNPAQYETLLANRQAQELEALRMSQVGSTSSPPPLARPNPGQPVNGMGAFRVNSPAQVPSAMPFSVSQPPPVIYQPQPPAQQIVPSTQPVLPVPPPIAGANTYFRESEAMPPVGGVPQIGGLPQNGGISQNGGVPQTGVIPQNGGVPQPENVAPMSLPKTGGIFSPSSNASKDSFEMKLTRMLVQAQNIATPESAEASSQTARSITAAISDVLKQQAQGVLYDISRWSLLNRLSDDERFVLASASGLLRPDILASVRAEELERRAKSLNSLSQHQFEEQMQRLRVSDHSNLVNIGSRSVYSARGMEDLAVMRRTAQRRQRLPNWANEALAQDANGGPLGPANGGIAEQGSSG